MKRIKANTEEGKKLAAKFGMYFMQDGGDISMSEIISGSKVTGVNPEIAQYNAEVEKDEFIQFPDGIVSKVAGKTHKKGGEKMQLEEGTMILSDNIKIGKDFKKSVTDLFDIKIKADTTFAKLHEKLKKKTGVTAAEKAQEEVVKELEKNQQVEDENTKRVNEEFLNAKLNETEIDLQKKKAQESFIFEMLFSAQEQRKESGDKDIRVEEVDEDEEEYKDGGEKPKNGTHKKSTRKGKKIAIYMDGKWYHFGDSKMQDFRQHKDKDRKKAWYARHAKNLKGDDPRAKAFRKYASITWEDGGEVYQDGGIERQTDLISQISDINNTLSSYLITDGQRIVLENDLLRLNVELDNLLADKEASTQPTTTTSTKKTTTSSNNTTQTPSRLTTAVDDTGAPTLKLDFGSGKYTYEDLSEEDRLKSYEEIDKYVTELAEAQGKTYEEALVDVIITGTSSKKTVSTALQKKLGASDSKKANQKLAQERGDLMLRLFKETAEKRGIDTSKIDFNVQINSEVGPDYVRGSSDDIYKPYQSMGLTVDMSKIPKERAAAGAQQATPQEQELFQPPNATAQNLFGLLPQAYIPKPSPLLIGQLNMPEYGTVTPIKVSPEQALRDNNRAAMNAMNIISQNVGSQQGANLANILAKTAEANNQILAQTEAANAQYKYQADLANAQARSQESAARTQAMDLFGQQTVRALENTQRELQNYYTAVSKDELGRAREMRELNTLRAFAPNYYVDPFTGQINFTNTGQQLYQYKTPLAAQVANVGGGNSNSQEQVNTALMAYLKNQGIG